MSTDQPYDPNQERDQVPFPPGATQQMAGQPAQLGQQQPGYGPQPSPLYQQNVPAGPYGYQQNQPGQAVPNTINGPVYGPRYPLGPQPSPNTNPPGVPHQPFYPQPGFSPQPHPLPSMTPWPAAAAPLAGPGSIVHTGQSLDWNQALELLKFLRGIEPARLVSLARIFMTMFGVENPSVEYALTLLERADLSRVFDAIEWLIQRGNEPSAVQAQALGLGFAEYLAIFQLISQLLVAIQRDPQQNVQAIRMLMAH